MRKRVRLGRSHRSCKREAAGQPPRAGNSHLAGREQPAACDRQRTARVRSSTSNASPDQLGVEVARNYDSPRDPRYWQNLQLANLPVDGDYPYISPDKKSGRPVKLPGSQGYRDKVGDRWVWDPNKQEWDVQHRDGSHTNVGEDGRITHAQGDLSGVAVLGVVTIGVVGLLVAPEITIPALGITATGYAAEGA